MRERFSTYFLVTFIAIAVWLYAEAETRERIEVAARVQFVGANSGWFIQSSADFDRRATLEIEGSRAALSRVREVLGQPLQLSPGMAAVPASDGLTQVNLLDALAGHPELERANVSLMSVRPLRVEVQVEAMEERELAIVPALAGIPVVGEVSIEPALVRVNARASLWEAVGEDAVVMVSMTPDQRASLPASGRVSMDAPLRLPEALRNQAGVDVSTRAARLEFETSQPVASETARVPVLVVLSPTEIGRWDIALEEDDRFKSVQLTGPPEAVDRLGAGEAALVAAIVLTLGDLEGGSGEKIATLQTRSGAPIPGEVSVQLLEAGVRFTATRRPAGE